MDELVRQRLDVQADLASQSDVEVLVRDRLHVGAAQRLEAGVGSVEPDSLEVLLDQDAGTESTSDAAAAARASTGAPRSLSGASASIAESQ